MPFCNSLRLQAMRPPFILYIGASATSIVTSSIPVESNSLMVQKFFHTLAAW